MAILLEANYSKKLGLPNYSSHQYSVTIRAELTDLTQVEAESARLYRVLQDAVDGEIQAVGFMPDATTYGMNNHSAGTNGHGAVHRNGANGPGPAQGREQPRNNGSGDGNGGSHWRCSERQQQLIEKVVRENNLNKREVDQLAVELFGAGVTELDRLQASGLIDELLERNGNKPRGQRRPYRREPSHVQTRGGNE